MAWGRVLTKSHRAFNIKADFGWVSHAQRWAARLHQWWMPFILIDVRLSKKKTEDCLDRFDMGIEVRCLQKALNTEDGLALKVGIGLTVQGTKTSFLSGQEQNWGQGLSDVFPCEDARVMIEIEVVLAFGSGWSCPSNLWTETSISRSEGYTAWCYDDDPQAHEVYIDICWPWIQRLKVRATCGAHCQSQWLQGH